MSTYVQELIGHARVDVAHAQHRLQTLLLLQATIKKDGMGYTMSTLSTHPPSSTLSTYPQPIAINIYNDATEKDEH